MMVVNFGEEALVYQTPNLVIIPLRENICFKQLNRLISHSIPFCSLKEGALF